mmetsp:Transcript_12255/g.23262  ORF Transcript_12255/g.23262 Transcript_12255/m.23262 type:complete len:98 (-) Transcript_12255:169-462(-)
MRISLLPTFRKLWGVIERDIDEGTYTVLIDNLYDVSEWDGTKRLIFTTSNALGGGDDRFGTILMVVGGLSLIAAAYFSIKRLLTPPKKFILADLKWD